MRTNSKSFLLSLCVSALFSAVGCKACTDDSWPVETTGAVTNPNTTTLSGTTSTTEFTGSPGTTTVPGTTSVPGNTSPSATTSVSRTSGESGATSTSDPPKFPALVFAQTRDGTNDDPVRVVQGGPGRDRAEADLEAGTFKVSALGITDAHDKGFAYAGVLRRLELRNHGVEAVVFPEGSIRVDISGTFSFGEMGDSDDSAGSILKALVGSHGALELNSTITHHVEVYWDSPTVERFNINDLPDDLVYEVEHSPSGMRTSMVFPEFSIAPGEKLELSLGLNTWASAWGGARGTVDYLSDGKGLSFSVTVPPGANIETNVSANAAWLKRGT